MHSISSGSVQNVLKQMKRGKSDVYDGLTSDYLKYGTEESVYCISLLATSIHKRGICFAFLL